MGQNDDDDADTAAARDAPLASFADPVAPRDGGAEIADGPDADDSTIQRPPELLRHGPPDVPMRVTGARPRGPARPPMPTLLGTGADDGSVTASAGIHLIGRPAAVGQPAPSVAARGAPPGARIEEPLDDTEGRTLVATSPDTGTGQGPAIGLPSPVEPDEPPIRISPKSLFDPGAAAPASASSTAPPTSPRLQRESAGDIPTAKVRRPVSAPGPVAASGPDPEGPCSGPASNDPYASGDSITTLGPAVVEDPATARRSSEPLEAPESVTTKAPGHITNMLRVLAADAPPDIAADADEDDDLPANQTAVMPGSPYYLGTTGGGPVASPLARPPDGAPAEHASVNLLALPSLGGGRAPGSGSVSYPLPTAPAPAKPRYVALVAIVALLSISVPIAVFFVLRGAGEEVAPSPRAPLTPSSEIVKRVEPARIKAPRSAPAPRGRRP